MLQIFLIGLGSALGGMSRYAMSISVHKLFGWAFPYGTFTVNLIGSFLIGFLFVLLNNRLQSITEPLRGLLIIGFLGGFTTFSAFSLETFNLFEEGRIDIALLNIFAICSLSLLLTWAGIILGRQCFN